MTYLLGTVTSHRIGWRLDSDGANFRKQPTLMSGCKGLQRSRPLAGPAILHRSTTIVTASSDNHGPGPVAQPTTALPPPEPTSLPALDLNPITSDASQGPPDQQLPWSAAATFPIGRELAGGKYKVLEVLGAGSNGVAYRAARPDGSQVALKALSLRSLRDWKQLELFQREGRTLSSLQHPGIPRYLDYFEEDDPQDRAFVLVQEVVHGKSLAAMIREGQRATEQEVMRIASELLSVLEYLGSLRPPVIHRDLKPDNIILEGGQWSGRVFLVDFGGVQAVASAGEMAGLGSTIVGTYGYMAPEQFRGAAEPASDLYGLGATLLYLLTGLPPSAFPLVRMRIDWRGSGSSGGPSASPLVTSPALAALLDGLLEPLAEDRLSCAEARELLQRRPILERQPSGPSSSRADIATSDFARRRAAAGAQSLPAAPPATALSTASWPSAPVARPAGTRVTLERSPGRLDVMIPPKGLSADLAFTGAFAIAWNTFVGIWTVGALASGGLLFALFSVPFWFAGAQLARGVLGGALMRERLAVGRSKWRLAQQLAMLGSDGNADFLEGQNEKHQEGATADLSGARVVTTAFVNGDPQTAIELVEGVNRCRFGEGLELVEQRWLVGEINNHIAELKGQDLDLTALPPPEMPQILRDDNSREDTDKDTDSNDD